MSDENPTPEAKPKADDWKAPASQDELNAIVEARLARERKRYEGFDEYKTKAEKFDEVQNASKSELERATARAEAAENTLATKSLESDRMSVALAKGLDPELAPLLSGATKEEIEKQADLLASHLTATTPTKPAPKTLKSGASGKDDAGMTGKERAAAAVRQLRGGN